MNTRLYGLAASVALAAVLGACVANVPTSSVEITDERMPIAKDAFPIEISNRGIVLFVLRLTQADFKGMPEVHSISALALDEDGKSTNRVYRIYTEKDYRNVYTEQQKFRDYLISAQLPPGNYNLTTFGIRTRTSKAIQVQGLVPVSADFRVATGKVIYLGSLAATMRSRKCGEINIYHTSTSSLQVEKASRVIPFFDQIVEGETSRVLGYSTGTFDFEVSNNIDRDLPVLRAEYPIMRNLVIESGRLLTIPKLSPEQISANCQREGAT
jgi:hypothetical protein